ncbi:GH39 family glycosyl hydrolase [Arsenophonus sp. PmNCSU2021_1]|uniref:GH39 family glycosyl hydrolase n=1 Tax=Arsenophonus sp. PmNCSU2021_1 TaxID=3118989 RepID=UPI002FF14A8D
MLNGGKQKPTNIEKYCQLVKKLVERYSINYHLIGLAYPISEYEIWNEPDLGFFWATPENNQRAVVEFYDFYCAVANTIRAAAPWVKIGSCGTAFVFKNENFGDNFITYIKNNHVPFDFYSYHYYAIDTANPKNIYEIQEYVRSTLNKYGFQQVKCYITEWALTANASKINNTKLQSHVAAADLLSFLIHAEKAGVDKAYLYRADGAEFGLFDNSAYATYAAQAFWLYNQFASQRDSSIIKLTDTSKTGITTTGAINANNQINILVANYTADPTNVGESGQTKLPTGVKLQSQYYIDTAIPATLIDNERWYGSNNVPPRNRNKMLYNGKPVPNGANSPNQNDQLKYDDVNYQQSSKGYIVTVTDIPANFNHYTIILHKVFNGGQRQTLNGETFIYEPYGTISQSREIVIKDDDPSTAGNNTLALITIELY